MSDNFLDSLLASGEVVLIETRQHWMAAIRYALRPILILLAAVGLVILNVLLGWDEGILGSLNQLILLIALVMFILSLIWLPIDLVRWWSRRYVLTSRRAMRMQGVVRKSSIDSSLEQINDIRTEQSLIGRTLGYADLTIYTASEMANERYAQLLDGLQFKRAVLEAKEAIRAGTLLTELPDGFIVKGGTNEASRRADGKLQAPAAPADSGSILPRRRPRRLLPRRRPRRLRRLRPSPLPAARAQEPGKLLPWSPRARSSSPAARSPPPSRSRPRPWRHRWSRPRPWRQPVVRRRGGTGSRGGARRSPGACRRAGGGGRDRAGGGGHRAHR